MRFAYADPPYPGQARRHYGGAGDPYEGHISEVDHAALIAELERDFPDGWALSTSASALQEVLAVCPPPPARRSGRRPAGAGVRVCAWLVPNAAPCPPQRVLWSWEPVLLRGGRWRRDGDEVFVRDAVVIPNMAGFLGGTLIGAKPAAFVEWVCHLLGARPGDELVDLFPGSGAVGDAWRRYSAELQLGVLS